MIGRLAIPQNILAPAPHSCSVSNPTHRYSGGGVKAPKMSELISWQNFDVQQNAKWLLGTGIRDRGEGERIVDAVGDGGCVFVGCGVL